MGAYQSSATQIYYPPPPPPTISLNILAVSTNVLVSFTTTPLITNTLHFQCSTNLTVWNDLTTFGALVSPSNITETISRQGVPQQFFRLLVVSGGKIQNSRKFQIPRIKIWPWQQSFWVAHNFPRRSTPSLCGVASLGTAVHDLLPHAPALFGKTAMGRSAGSAGHRPAPDCFRGNGCFHLFSASLLRFALPACYPAILPSIPAARLSPIICGHPRFESKPGQTWSNL